MPNPSQDEPNLRALVISLITLIKSNAELISELSVEIAALKRTMIEVDPKFEAILDVQREQTSQKLGRGKQQILDRFDEWMRELSEG
jgi:hypothetical protein